MAAKSEAGTFTVKDYEFKVTVRPNEERKVHALLESAGVKPVQRKVYFYDTPKLALFKEHGVVVRARVTESDDDDSTIKLRPLPGVIPARWIATEKVETGVDVVGEKAVFMAKVDHKPVAGRIEQVEQGALKPGKLFNKAQEALVKAELPLKDIVLLGRVDARKWDLPQDTFPHELSVEEWSLDHLHFIELSFKVAPVEGESAKAAFHAFLKSRKIGRKGRPDPKTTIVLEYLAQRLA